MMNIARHRVFELESIRRFVSFGCYAVPKRLCKSSAGLLFWIIASSLFLGLVCPRQSCAQANFLQLQRVTHDELAHEIRKTVEELKKQTGSNSRLRELFKIQIHIGDIQGAYKNARICFHSSGSWDDWYIRESLQSCSDDSGHDPIVDGHVVEFIALPEMKDHYYGVYTVGKIGMHQVSEWLAQDPSAFQKVERHLESLKIEDRSIGDDTYVIERFSAYCSKLISDGEINKAAEQIAEFKIPVQTQLFHAVCNELENDQRVKIGNRLLKLLPKLKEDPNNQGQWLQRCWNTEFQRKRYEQAVEFHRQLCERKGYEPGLTNRLSFCNKLYQADQFELADPLLNQCLVEFRKLNDEQRQAQELSVFQHLVMCMSSKKDLTKAIEYTMLVSELLDDLEWNSDEYNSYRSVLSEFSSYLATCAVKTSKSNQFLQMIAGINDEYVRVIFVHRLLIHLNNSADQMLWYEGFQDWMGWLAEIQQVALRDSCLEQFVSSDGNMLEAEDLLSLLSVASSERGKSKILQQVVLRELESGTPAEACRTYIEQINELDNADYYVQHGKVQLVEKLIAMDQLDLAMLQMKSIEQSQWIQLALPHIVKHFIEKKKSKELIQYLKSIKEVDSLMLAFLLSEFNEDVPLSEFVRERLYKQMKEPHAPETYGQIGPACIAMNATLSEAERLAVSSEYYYATTIGLDDFIKKRLEKIGVEEFRKEVTKLKLVWIRDACNIAIAEHLVNESDSDATWERIQLESDATIRSLWIKKYYEKWMLPKSD